MTECTPCRLNADLDVLPAPERAYVNEDWRLAHAWSSLPGYMILLPLRHVVALDELTPRETAVLGPLLSATTAALRAVAGCRKTYVMLFAERDGFEHLHFHLVPRMAELDDDHLGPGTLAFVNGLEEDWVPPTSETAWRVRSAGGSRSRCPRRPFSLMLSSQGRSRTPCGRGAGRRGSPCRA